LPARRVQHNGTRAAIEQHLVERLFQRADLQTDRRGGQPDFRGCGSKAAVLGHSQKSLECTD